MGKNTWLTLGIVGIVLVAIYWISKKTSQGTTTNITQEAPGAAESIIGSIIAGGVSIFDKWMGYKKDSDNIANNQGATVPPTTGKTY